MRCTWAQTSTPETTAVHVLHPPASSSLCLSTSAVVAVFLCARLLRVVTALRLYVVSVDVHAARCTPEYRRTSTHKYQISLSALVVYRSSVVVIIVVVDVVRFLARCRNNEVHVKPKPLVPE